MPVTTDVKIKQMAYVILYVKDIEKALPFYRDTLGLKVRVAEKGWAELETGNTTLALHNEEPGKSTTRGYGQPNICFAVDDVFATYEALKAKGVKFESEPKTVCEAPDKTGKSCDFHDPDGNFMSIFAYVKK